MQAKIDKLGRMVIPQELRKAYGLDCGTAIEFSRQENGVLIRAKHVRCVFCHAKEGLLLYQNAHLCATCKKAIGKL